MSINQANEPSATQPNIILTEKQDRVRVCLPACLRRPPRFDLKIRPGGQRRFVATFDKTAAGVSFGEVESSNDQIIIPAEYDIAALDIDFERLAANAELDSVEETKEVWESIKELVQPAPPATPVPEHATFSDVNYSGATTATDTQHDDHLHAEQLYAAAASIGLDASRSPDERHVGEKPRNSRIIVLKLPSIKRKHRHNSTTGDDLSQGVESGRGEASTTLLSKPKYGSGGRLARPVPGRPESLVVILPLRKRKKSSTIPQRSAPKPQSIEPKHDLTITADGASISCARSSGLRATSPLRGQFKRSGDASSRPGSDPTTRRSKATHRSANQDRPALGLKLKSATSTSRKRKGEDGPFGEGNVPQTPIKRRMAMKEESWKGSQ